MTWLLERVKHIGKDVLDYLQTKPGATMIPPIPDSKFIDKLPESMRLQGQDGYETEVEIFRYLEDLKLRKSVIVLHQLEYTHQQYSAFLPDHLCCVGDCERLPEIHKCHQPRKNTEGETDFLVLGDYFALVLEVKGVEAVEDIQRHLDHSVGQRQRIVNLIRSIDNNLPVFEFTVFSKIAEGDVSKDLLFDTTLIFREHVKCFEQIIDYAHTLSTSASANIVKQCLLGLWCINQDNKWDLSHCSLSKCIIDINNKLKKSLVSKKSIDEAEHKRKKQKLLNPTMVEAPNLFKKYLHINCLSKDQCDLFHRKERCLWVESPAGSGKTIVMLGKIIDTALNSPPHERILVIVPGDNNSPVLQLYRRLFNSIREDIKFVEVQYNHGIWNGDITGKLNRAKSSLSKQLMNSDAKIVLLQFVTCMTEAFNDVIYSYHYHVFVDDFQGLFDRTMFDIKHGSSFAQKNVISQGLLPLMDDPSNLLKLWIFSDNAQTWFIKFFKLFKTIDSDIFISVRQLREKCSMVETLTVNLRNSLEISTTLSIIRKHYENMDIPGTFPLTWPQQENGHFLHGTKSVIYLVQSSKTERMTELLADELWLLKGSQSFLENKDIAILLSMYDDPCSRDTKYSIKGELEKWGSMDNQIPLYNAGECMSAEWPAVIFICRYEYFKDTKSNESGELVEYSASSSIPLLYIALSRARVYFSMILYNYSPKYCQYTKNLLEELIEHGDVCKIVELKS